MSETSARLRELSAQLEAGPSVSVVNDVFAFVGRFFSPESPHSKDAHLRRECARLVKASVDAALLSK